MRQDGDVAKKKDALDDDVDELFTLPPAEFTKARDELAARLKAEGRSDEATEVKALRRPTVAAWAANQVARQRPDDIQELLAAGNDLRQAQRKVLSGVKAGGFREAMDRRRKVVTTLTRAAEDVLRQAGHASQGAAEAVSATFEAASLDTEAADLVKAGRLTKEFAAPSGFGGVTGLEVVATPPERPKPRPRQTPQEKAKSDAARAATEAARGRAKELEREAAEARRQLMRSRSVATRAQENADRLAREADGARAEAKQAMAELKKAETEAKRAETAAERAAAKVPAD
jgi:hypothetical protein